MASQAGPAYSLDNIFTVDHSALTTILKDLLGRLHGQSEKLTQLEVIIREKDDQIKALAHLVKGNNQRIDDMGERVDLVAKRSDDLASEIEQCASNVDVVRQDTASLDKRVAKLEAAAAAKPSRASSSVADALNAASAAGGGVSSEVLTRLAAVEARVSEVDVLGREVDRLDRDKVSTADHDAAIRALEESLERLREQLAKAQSQLRHHEEAIEAGKHKRNGTRGRDDGDDKVSPTSPSGSSSSSSSSSSAAAGDAGRWASKEMLAGYVEKQPYDTELADLQEKDAQAASEIRKLWNQLRKAKEGVDEAREAGVVRDAQLAELRQAIGALGKLVNALTDRVNEGVSRKDLFALREDLVGQVKGAAGALKEHVRKELRRFEKDVMEYVGEAAANRGGGAGGASGAGDGTETAIGKVYFRCLTCNQVTGSQHGPHSRHYQQAMGIPLLPGGGPVKTLAIGAGGTQAALAMIAGGGMVVERGDDLTLHGADGQVYKGREDPVVHFASPMDGLLAGSAGGDAAAAAATATGGVNGPLSARRAAGAITGGSGPPSSAVGGLSTGLPGGGTGSSTFRVVYVNKEKPAAKPRPAPTSMRAALTNESAGSITMRPGSSHGTIGGSDAGRGVGDADAAAGAAGAVAFEGSTLPRMSQTAALPLASASPSQDAFSASGSIPLPQAGVRPGTGFSGMPVAAAADAAAGVQRRSLPKQRPATSTGSRQV